jgi:hypothetical protein
MNKKYSLILKIIFLSLHFFLINSCSKYNAQIEKKYSIAAKAIIKAFENKDYYNSFIAYSDLNIHSLNYFHHIWLVNLYSNNMKSFQRKLKHTQSKVNDKIINHFEFIAYDGVENIFFKEELEFIEKDSVVLLNFFKKKSILNLEGYIKFKNYSNFEIQKASDKEIQEYYKKLNATVKTRHLKIVNVKNIIRDNQNVYIIPISLKSYLEIKQNGNLITIVGYKNDLITKTLILEDCKLIKKIVLNSSVINHFEL